MQVIRPHLSLALMLIQHHIFILFVNYEFRDEKNKAISLLTAQFGNCFSTTFANNKVEANQSK